MTIQSISNQNVTSLTLMSALKKIPYELFENICSNLEPLDMQNFVSTCKDMRQLNSDCKEVYPKSYSKLMTQVLSNSFGDKSIEQLSDEMIALCDNTNSFQLEHLLSRKKASDEEVTLYQKSQFITKFLPFQNRAYGIA